MSWTDKCGYTEKQKKLEINNSDDSTAEGEGARGI